MFRNIALVLTLIGATLLWMSFGIGVPKVYTESVETARTPHVDGDESRHIGTIHITAFYFVPKDRENRKIESWRELLEKNFQKLTTFHSLQFKNQSEILVTLYPEPIIGALDAIGYDTENTEYGNPRALISIGKEIEERVFREGGDLFDVSFDEVNKNTYSVLFILYEGLGASGGVIRESKEETPDKIGEEFGLGESIIFPVDITSQDGFFMLNREFLAGVSGVFGDSIFAHEFYHTVGILDGYVVNEESPLSSDLMGFGRERPLSKTYLSAEVLDRLGI